MTTYYTPSGNPPSNTRGLATLVRAEFTLIQTGFAAVDASFTAAALTVAPKGAIAGQVWTGVHDFSGATSVLVPTRTYGTTGQYAVNMDTLNAAVFAAANLPAQAANSGKFLTTNGTTPSWAAITFQTAAASSDIKTGTDNTKVVTPSGLLAAQGFTAYAQTADQAITSAGSLTIAHGLGRAPVLVLGFLKNVTTEGNYSTGDVIPHPLGTTYIGAANSGVSYTADATNLTVRFGSGASVMTVINKTTGATLAATNANWSFFLRAWA